MEMGLGGGDGGDAFVLPNVLLSGMGGSTLEAPFRRKGGGSALLRSKLDCFEESDNCGAVRLGGLYGSLLPTTGRPLFCGGRVEELPCLFIWCSMAELALPYLL